MLSLELDDVSGKVDRMLIAYDKDERMIGHKGLGIQWQRHGNTSCICGEEEITDNIQRSGYEKIEGNLQLTPAASQPISLTSMKVLCCTLVILVPMGDSSKMLLKSAASENIALMPSCRRDRKRYTWN